MQSRSNKLGYTLIELIVVIVVLTVLSVSIAPRFFTALGTSEYLYRDQALNLLRLVQMQAMQCTDCPVPVISISANAMLANAASCSDDSNQALCPAERDNIRFTASASPIQFDSMGRPQGCGGTCQLTVQGESALALCIESEGYIHPC
jgi:MSHA pilin protein MshC